MVLTVKQVAEHLHCSTHQVYGLIGDGRLPAINISRKPKSRGAWRVPLAGLQKFVANGSS